jgi:hypothetical protein
MIRPAPPRLRNGPCAYGIELEAVRRAKQTPTLFDDLDESVGPSLTVEPAPPPLTGTVGERTISGG